MSQKSKYSSKITLIKISSLQSIITELAGFKVRKHILKCSNIRQILIVQQQSIQVFKRLKQESKLI